MHFDIGQTLQTFQEVKLCQAYNKECTCTFKQIFKKSFL